MPEPRTGESQEEFISRCMASPEANDSFPEHDRRAAFCYSQWENRNKMKKPTTHAELEDLKTGKLGTFYKVNKSYETITKDVDFTKRIVKSIANTYMFFDQDQDVLLPGVSAKSIQERGPNSIGEAKIKNVKDHQISVRIGKPLILDEREIDGHKVLYGESRMLTSTIGNDMLIEYQEGVIDQHSIGFRYMDLELVTADDESWTKWKNQLINPQDAEEIGYMFLVKEIELFEWSPVSFGSNKLTSYLGVKSENKQATILKINDRLDLLEKQLRSGKQSDYAMFDYELETRQLKQIITELFEQEPSIKDTLLAQRRLLEDTREQKTVTTICQHCMKSFSCTSENGYCKCPGCGKFTEYGRMQIAFDLDKAIKETKFFNH